MASSRRYTKKTTRRFKIKLSPKEAETIINEEFTTKYGNKIRKRYIFKPQLPNDPTINFELKGDRKEAE